MSPGELPADGQDPAPGCVMGYRPAAARSLPRAARRWAFRCTGFVCPCAHRAARFPFELWLLNQWDALTPPGYTLRI